LRWQFLLVTATVTPPGCGISYGQYACLTLSRFGQYIVGLDYRPGGSEAGLKAADVENLLRALDSLAMERLGAQRR